MSEEVEGAAEALSMEFAETEREAFKRDFVAAMEPYVLRRDAAIARFETSCLETVPTHIAPGQAHLAPVVAAAYTAKVKDLAGSILSMMTAIPPAEIRRDAVEAALELLEASNEACDLMVAQAERRNARRFD